jgi:hypothetical protein
MDLTHLTGKSHVFMVKNIKNDLINDSNGLKSLKSPSNWVRSSSWVDFGVLGWNPWLNPWTQGFPWWNLMKNHEKLIKINKIILNNSPWGCSCNGGRWSCWRGERDHEIGEKKSSPLTPFRSPIYRFFFGFV